MNDIPPPAPPLAPLPRDQRNIDGDHLNLLAIFHYVVAGLEFLGILFLIAHFALMHFFLANAALWQGQRSGPPPQALLPLLMVFYFIFGAWFLISAILNVLSGLFLHERKYRTFSLVVAGLNCVHLPVGTVLGIFTIIVLLRPSVQEIYDGGRQMRY